MAETKKRVLVAGASGGTGRELLSALRESEYTVVALTSSSAKTETLDVMGADEVVVGDLMDGEDARRAVAGCDAVVWSIPRADIARPMVAALETPDAENRTFEVVARTRLRGRTRGVVDVDWAAV